MTNCTCDAFTSTGLADALLCQNTGNGTGGGRALYAYSHGTNPTVHIEGAGIPTTSVVYAHSSGGAYCPYVFFAEGAMNGILGKTYISSGSGVIGQSQGSSGSGVLGQSNGDGGFGVFAQENGSTPNFAGLKATSVNGWGAYCQGATYGVYGSAVGTNGVGVNAYANVSGGIGLTAFGSSKAASLNGAVDVIGYLNKSGGGFKIDHPADPENKYLNHEFVESDRAKNIYDGELTFDKDGKATVEMPAWYNHVSANGRLMVMPQETFMPLATKKISEGKWEVSGGTPGGKADYFLVATRSDKWAVENHPGVEIEKPADKKGFFLHPELHGFGHEKHETSSMRDKK